MAMNRKSEGGMVRSFSKLVAVLLLILPAAMAQQTRVFGDGGNWTQEITGSLSGVRNLRVKVDVGTVKVEGGSQNGVSYVVRNHSYTSSETKARHEFDSYKVTAYVRGDTAWIVGDWEGGHSHKFSGEFSISVPREMDEIKVETDGGNVTTTGVSGRVDAQSGGGNIRLDDIAGIINAETGGGNIDVGNVASDVNLHTGGGTIKIMSAKGKIVAESGGGNVIVVAGFQGAELETGGGNIQVDRCTGKVTASTGGGTIDLGDLNGPAEIETGGGSIRLASARGPVKADTGSGSIELLGVPSAQAETGAGGIEAKFIATGGESNDSVLETSVGDITVYVAPNVKLSIRASIEVANGHRIDSEFSEIKVTTEGGDYGSKTVTAEGNLNGGGPVLKVRTTTGDISFRRSGH